MPLTNEDKNQKMTEIFNAVAESLVRNLQSGFDSPDWIKCAIQFLKENGEFSQLPIPGSAIKKVSDALPFKRAN